MTVSNRRHPRFKGQKSVILPFFKFPKKPLVTQPKWLDSLGSTALRKSTSSNKLQRFKTRVESILSAQRGCQGVNRIKKESKTMLPLRGVNSRVCYARAYSSIGTWSPCKYTWSGQPAHRWASRQSGHAPTVDVAKTSCVFEQYLLCFQENLGHAFRRSVADMSLRIHSYHLNGSQLDLLQHYLQHY